MSDAKKTHDEVDFDNKKGTKRKRARGGEREICFERVKAALL